MQPRSKHWHLIDYVLVQRQDLSEIEQMRSMRGTNMLSDHCLVRCKTSLLCKRKQKKSSCKTIDETEREETVG